MVTGCMVCLSHNQLTLTGHQLGSICRLCNQFRNQIGIDTLPNRPVVWLGFLSLIMVKDYYGL